MMPKERPNEIGEVALIVAKKKKKVNDQRTQKPEDFIIKDVKEKSLEAFDEEEEDEVTSCKWSGWSDWSKCGTDFLKQRTRFCVGLKGWL